MVFVDADNGSWPPVRPGRDVRDPLPAATSAPLARACPGTAGRLLPRAGWTTTSDVVVVGSGIAGLTAALRLEDKVGRVLVVTKDVLNAGSTQWAQGGIAAALGPGDTPDQHERDTLVAGAGACDPDAVRVLVTEGPERGPRADRARHQLRPRRRRRALA